MAKHTLNVFPCSHRLVFKVWFLKYAIPQNLPMASMTEFQAFQSLIKKKLAQKLYLVKIINNTLKQPN